MSGRDSKSQRRAGVNLPETRNDAQTPGSPEPAGLDRPRPDSDQTGFVADQAASDSDQTGSGADQAASDSDQTGSGADQAASDSDQTGSDADQAAAEADQVAADRDFEQTDQAPARARAYAVSRAERADAAVERTDASMGRKASTASRVSTALARIEETVSRDEAAVEAEVRRRTALEVEHERALLADAEELACAGSWEYDPGTSSLTWSPGMYRIRGRSLDERPLTVEDATREVHPEDRPRVAVEYAHADPADDDLRSTHRIIREDGSVRHLETRSRVERDVDGRAVRIVGVCVDVTDRAQAQSELAAAQEVAGLGSWEWEIATGSLKWSATLRRIYGVEADARVDFDSFLALVHPGDRDRVQATVQTVYENLEPGSFEHRIVRGDGVVRVLQCRCEVITGNARRPVRMLGTAQDVTDRKRVDAALVASERRTRQILESAHDAFVAIDADGVVTDWNRRAQAMFGWTAVEAIGRDLAATIIPVEYHDAHRLGVRRFVAGGESNVLGRVLEVSAVHRDGHEFPVELTIAGGETGDGYSFNAFVRDITERRRAQQELTLARDQALEASQMKSRFVANVSHEIRTPMNGVIGMSGLLLDTDLEDDQREYAELISSSAEALLEVIDGILDFSKIEAGKLELDPTDFDLRDAIEEACGIQVPRAHTKGLELVVAIDRDLPALLHGDVARLRQVIANFVSNAIKFTAQGEVVVRARAATASEHATVVRVEVSDTGIGIERAALERLFRPFSQADGSTTRKYGGTGLGLAISRQLIELMGGSVGAESEPGQGSTFWFEVALARPAAGEAVRAPQRGLAGLRVLVVDDHATSRGALEQQLGSWQTSCSVAENAAAAMELLQSAAAAGTPYALALLDQGMPDVEGHALARAIRAQPALRDMRLVLLGVSWSRPEFYEPPTLFDRVLTKPVRQSRLYNEIQTLIAGESPADRRVQAPEGVDFGVAGKLANLEVLVVEDNAVNQAVAVRILAKCGFRARVAEDGRKALEALSERSYAAVLMDCQMPGLDGYQTTMRIRASEQDGPRIPIIATTAHSMRGERERCLAAGMDDYLTKPLRNQTLKDTLKRWVTEPPNSARGLPDLGPPESAAGYPALLDKAVIADLDFNGADLSKILVMYFDEARAQMSELAGAINRGETLTVAQTAHTLKGSSSSIGASRVTHLASELEASATAKNLTGAPQLLDRLRTSLAETRKAFAST